MAPELTILTTK